MRQHIAIVVLNWNNAIDTISCLNSLVKAECPLSWIIVVDNGSTDDSVSAIQKAHPDIMMLETGANLGYAGGNNVGIRHALAEGASALFILNNDVTVESEFLRPLLTALESSAQVGIATPAIVEAQSAREAWAWAVGARIDWANGSVERLHCGRLLSDLRHLAPFDVEVAPGSAMLVRRSVFEDVGLFDESYFLYFEEADWCIAVRNAGYRILAVPGAHVAHRVTGTLGQSSPITDYYMTRNRIHFINRHWRYPHRILLLARIYLRQAAAIYAYTLNSHSGHRIPNRNARMYGLRDASLGRWGQMGRDVANVCAPGHFGSSPGD